MLSRCPRLRLLRITFRDADPDSLIAALASLEAAAALGLVVSLLRINYITIRRKYSIGAARFASFLGAMARFSPQELVLTDDGYHECYNVDLPCFHRTTAIEMSWYSVRFTLPPVGEFPALERLSLEGCTIVDLATLVTRCPRLRVLKATTDNHTHSVVVHSTSLEELDLDAYRDMECRSIDIVTPLLKQLKLKVQADTELNMSISSPMVEKVLLTRLYTQLPLLFGFWLLGGLRLETRESYKYKDGVLNNNNNQLPHIHVLILDISSHTHSYFDVVPLNLAHEMKKLPITNFSTLEVNLSTTGHAFGPLMLCLLGMHHIETAMQSLKVNLSRWSEMSQTSKCLENCLCNEPKNWRSQSICLTHLGEVEINNFSGRDSEIDFITVIFRWAPMLKRMTIKLAYAIKQSDIRGCVTNISNICLVYPSVDCFIYPSYGELVWRTCIQLTSS